ncbi:MAG: hypothetical protein RBT11_03005 [Desulfobacterales bacterium]|jgi:hypothetical protein|nr:hypothetical protein [Desulfobacterales bacterium]
MSNIASVIQPPECSGGISGMKRRRSNFVPHFICRCKDDPGFSLKGPGHSDSGVKIKRQHTNTLPSFQQCNHLELDIKML